MVEALGEHNYRIKTELAKVLFSQTMTNKLQNAVTRSREQRRCECEDGNKENGIPVVGDEQVNVSPTNIATRGSWNMTILAGASAQQTQGGNKKIAKGVRSNDEVQRLDAKPLAFTLTRQIGWVVFLFVDYTKRCATIRVRR